jgi:hypothetical protein
MGKDCVRPENFCALMFINFVRQANLLAKTLLCIFVRIFVR